MFTAYLLLLIPHNLTNADCRNIFGGIEGFIKNKYPVLDFIVPNPLLPQENVVVAFEKMRRPHCRKKVSRC